MDLISNVDRRRLASTCVLHDLVYMNFKTWQVDFAAIRVLTLGRRRGSDLGKLQRLLGSGNVLILDMVVVTYMRSPKL